MDEELKLNHVDVLILGGGLAGLGAAIALSETQKNTKRCTYLVLEAQNKAGGRVRSEELLTYPPNKYSCVAPENSLLVDTGAQWLHGRNNSLYTISENYQLLSSKQSEEGIGSFFYENSNKIDSFSVKKVDFQICKLLGECEEFARNKIDPFPKSVGQFLRDKFQTFVDGLENLQDKECALNLLDWHIRFQMVDNSCLNLDQLSAKYWGKYSFNGESCQAHYNFKNCFASIIDCLINEFEKNSIHYNKEVIKIRVNDNRIENLNNIANPSNHQMANISVECSDGSLYTANHVIVSFSLGVLKKMHEILFKPSLPYSMQLAIESIGFGAINKILMVFKTAWWQDLDGIQFVFNHKKKVFWFILSRHCFLFVTKNKINDDKYFGKIPLPLNCMYISENALDRLFNRF